MSETTARGTRERQARPRPVPNRRVPPGRPREYAPQAPPRAPQALVTPRSRRAGVPARERAANRMPFIILLCGLLSGALVCTLMINTTLAEGAFTITSLQHSDNALARQQQQLEEEVAAAQSAPVIEQRAYQLGMRPGQLQFLNLKTGKVQSTAGPGANSATGYVP